MNKITAFAAMAALTATLAMPLPGFASEYSGNDIVLADHSMRTSKLVGAQVYNGQGQSIGSVMEVLVKQGAAEPMVVLSVGDYLGTGPKMVAVPLSHINLDDGKPRMAGANKQMLASMPVFLFPPGMYSNG